MILPSTEFDYTLVQIVYHCTLACFVTQLHILTFCDPLTPWYALDTAQKSIDNWLDSGITLEQPLEETVL